MLTNSLKHILKPRAVYEMKMVKGILDSKRIFPAVIADVGANIGYYTEAILSVFDSSELHSYEPHPMNLNYLEKLCSDKLHVHPYGLFNTNTLIPIGMRDSRKNNGTFSIFNKHDVIDVVFKDANEELIRPEFVKIDVEGSELYILECDRFFENTKAIFIEIICTDEFKSNSAIKARLQNMGFHLSKQITKNDQLWLKL